MFLAISTNSGDPTPHLAAEGAQMGALIADGTVAQVWLKADWSGAVIVLNADDLAGAQAAVATLPMVQHGLTIFEFTEVVVPPK